ncbi:hypothetical protein P3L10_000008 [Capsicum annuum]
MTKREEKQGLKPDDNAQLVLMGETKSRRDRDYFAKLFDLNKEYNIFRYTDFIVNKVRRMLYEAVSSFNGDLEDEETMSRLIKAEFAVLRDAFNLPPESDDCVRKVAAKLLNLYRTGRLGHYTLDLAPSYKRNNLS